LRAERQLPRAEAVHPDFAERAEAVSLTQPRCSVVDDINDFAEGFADMIWIVLPLVMLIGFRCGLLVEDDFRGLGSMGAFERWIVAAHVIPIVFMLTSAVCVGLCAYKFIVSHD
jgi:hypothetical protein